jgi:hypothetical protein
MVDLKVRQLVVHSALH